MLIHPVSPALATPDWFSSKGTQTRCFRKEQVPQASHSQQQTHVPNTISCQLTSFLAWGREAKAFFRPALPLPLQGGFALKVIIYYGHFGRLTVRYIIKHNEPRSIFFSPSKHCYSRCFQSARSCPEVQAMRWQTFIFPGLTILNRHVRVQPPSRAGLVPVPSRTLRALVTMVFALPLLQRGDQVTNGNVKPTRVLLKQGVWQSSPMSCNALEMVSCGEDGKNIRFLVFNPDLLREI